MAAASETIQTIAKLTPLAEVLSLIDREVKPVAPRQIALPDAWQATLAADVVSAAQPAAPLALIDGWALSADLTRDAGGYAPAPLPQVPLRIEAGHPMPDGTDSVAAFDLVKLTRVAPRRSPRSIPGTACCRLAAIATYPCRCAAPANACARSTLLPWPVPA